MEHKRSQREEEELRRKARRAERPDEGRRRRSWIGDAEIARSLNAALQDDELRRDD